ncbi:3-phosphoshikimate 1-carboxyvinyltransferase [Pyrococcus kukulkanii]|uniref:3-phosphoshikimate 1-carboxyvinyltransferase n=1 Tax=Pyrococcus kukulkanii TaxID=1609559 RepID=UPI003569ECE8
MLKIVPILEVNGEIRAPPSKSYTHRAYFLSLLAERKSRIISPLISDDTLATIDVIRAFGAELQDDSVIPPGELKPNYFFVRESGTTARITIALATLAHGKSVVDGRGRLKERPMDDLVLALRNLGSKIYGMKLPIIIEGGQIKSGKVEINASKSSQFVTALLLLGSKMGLEVKVTNPVSWPYVEMTLRAMDSFGVRYERERLRFIVYPGVRGANYEVPGDYSSASFFLVAGALFGRVKVENLLKDDVQADMAIIGILEEAGAKVKVGKRYVEVRAQELRPINVDCSQFPDLFPILAVLAAYAPGKSIIRGRQLRLKESDRVHAMVVNLARAGIKVKELKDGLEIHGGRPKGVVVEDFNDHRIAMAMAILGLGAEGVTVIKNERVVNKSYPNFFEDLRRLLQ